MGPLNIVENNLGGERVKKVENLCNTPRAWIMSPLTNRNQVFQEIWVIKKVKVQVKLYSFYDILSTREQKDTNWASLTGVNLSTGVCVCVSSGWTITGVIIRRPHSPNVPLTRLKMISHGTDTGIAHRLHTHITHHLNKHSRHTHNTFRANKLIISSQ